MSFRKDLLTALEAIRDEISGLRVALVEREKDTAHRLHVLENEATRTERRLVDVERKVARVATR